jgi:hypothetical protein
MDYNVNKRKLRHILCGMLLGDGFLSQKEMFGFGHSLKQQDYALWKAELINNIFREKNLPKRCKPYIINHKLKGKIYPAIHVNFYWTKYCKILQERIYKPHKTINYLLEQISEDSLDKNLCLAIWFMDDGSESRRISCSGKFCNPHITLHTYAFTEGEHNLIIEWFKKNYGVIAKPCKTAKGYYTRFTASDSKKLIQNIISFIIQTESMRNKFKLCIERYSQKDTSQLEMKI